MPFNPISFEENYKKRIKIKDGNDTLLKKINTFRTLNTPKQKALFIKVLIEELRTQVGDTSANRVMQGCGMSCIGESVIKKAKKLYKESEDMTEFLDKLNKNHIGGGRLELNGDIINGGYDTCYCGSVSNTREAIPITYCYCSTGWYKRLFEEVLDRPAKVDVLESIVSGADKCEFMIFI